MKAILLSASIALSLGAAEIPMRARGGRPAPPAPGKSFPIGKPVAIRPPLGLPPVPIPEDNPPTEETITLGRKLFFDPVLSRDNKVSCSSCHSFDDFTSDSKRFSEGYLGRKGNRQAMPVINAAYHLTQFWDGRAASLEDQTRFPVPDMAEMAHSLVGVERRLAADKDYVRMFAKAFGPGRITYEMVAKSIASYERTLLSGNSPFDRYYYGGDKSAMSASAIRGLEQFNDLTLDGPNCISCHRIEPKYATFTENRFHNTGVAWDAATKSYLDQGRIAVSGQAKDAGAFKVVTLRNVARTAPYMHDGSMKTLAEVVDFYVDGGKPNPLLSGVMPHKGLPRIAPNKLQQAKLDIIEFLKALNGEIPPGARPPEMARASK
jgi:cytochrome c peroxidase